MKHIRQSQLEHRQRRRKTPCAGTSLRTALALVALGHVAAGGCTSRYGFVGITKPCQSSTCDSLLVEQGAECGSFDNGCGTLVDCNAACTGGNTCGGGGIDQQCGMPAGGGCATAPLRTSAATADHGFGTIHYFCSSGGDDANDGLSSSTPKASWSAAILTFNSMPAGDTVALCRGGSWTGSSNNVYNGNCRKYDTCDFRDYGTGNLPVISYNESDCLFYVGQTGHDEGYRWWNIHVENVSGQETDWFFSNDVSDVDICNVEVHGGQMAIDDAAGVAGQARNSRFTVRNSAFSNTSGVGVWAASSDFTIDADVFTNVGDATSGTSGYAIYVEEEDIGPRSDTDAMETQNLRITNNTMTMDSSVECGAAMIRINGRQNSGLVENNYMLAAKGGVNNCVGIAAGANGYGTAAWFRKMTYRRNRIFLLEQNGPSQAGIALDSHGTVASDVNGQSVYTLNETVPPAIVADNIIVLGGSFPAGVIYQANDSAASSPGDVTSGIITYNNSIYFPNAQNGSDGIDMAWGTGGGDSYVVQNNAVYAPNSTCVNNPQGYLAGRSTPNYCRTADGATNGLRTDALNVVWTDAGNLTNPNFSLPPGSPLIGAGSTTDFDPYAIAPADVPWNAADLAEDRTAPIDIGAVSSH